MHELCEQLDNKDCNYSVSSSLTFEKEHTIKNVFEEKIKVEESHFNGRINNLLSSKDFQVKITNIHKVLFLYLSQFHSNAFSRYLKTSFILIFLLAVKTVFEQIHQLTRCSSKHWSSNDCDWTACKYMNTKCKTWKIRSSYCCWRDLPNSPGFVNIQVLILNSMVIPLNVGVVPSNALQGVWERPDTILNVIQHRTFLWNSVPLKASTGC